MLLKLKTFTNISNNHKWEYALKIKTVQMESIWCVLKWCFSLFGWLISVYSFCFVVDDFLELQLVVVYGWIFVFRFDVFLQVSIVLFFVGLFRGFCFLTVENMSCCSEDENFLSRSFPSWAWMKAWYCHVPGIVTSSSNLCYWR